MTGAFLAFVVRKAREEFSRTVEQTGDNVLLPGMMTADSSKSKYFDYGFVTAIRANELLVA